MLRLYRYYYYKMYQWMTFVKERHPQDAVIFGVSMPVMLYWLGLFTSLTSLLEVKLSDLREVFIISIVTLLIANFWYFKFRVSHNMIVSEFEVIDTPARRRTSLIAFLFTVMAFPFPWLMTWLISELK